MLRWTEPERLDQAWRDGLLGPGALFELVDEDVLGHQVPVFAQRPRSVSEILTRAAESYGDRAYLIGPDRTVTFAEAPLAARRIAAALADHGVHPGDRVALAGGFSVEHALALWGAARAGAVVVTLNPRWTAAELAHAIGLTEPVLAVVDPAVVDALPPGVPTLTFDALVAESEQLDDDGRDWSTDDGPGDDEPFAVVFTSGTTGRAKGATLSHRNAVHFSLGSAASAAVHSILHELPPASSGMPRVIGSSPLFHISGLLGQVTNGAFWGTGLVLAPAGRWDETVHLELTERHAVTSWSIVPTQLWRLVDHPELDRFDLSSLELVGGGGATFEPELLRRTAERIPHVATALRVGYGMTETAGAISMLQPPIAAEQASSVGTAVAGNQIEIRSPDGTPLPDGEIGQIWGRGAQVFLGYWNDPEATAAVLDDERWYATGDFGRITGGFLHLESRLRDLIIRGGENIYPIEIENRLVEHPAVAEAAVIGLAHPTLGQEVKAVVVLRAGEAASADDIRTWVAVEHAGYKVPTVVEFRAELPRNDSGKVMKHLLETSTPPA